MALALEARAMKEDILVGDSPKARARRGRLSGLETRGRLWKHATLADLDGLIPPEAAAGLFTFAMVRNPWDRAVSYYHWLRQQRFDHPAVGLASALGFSEFLHHDHTKASLRQWPYGRYLQTPDGTERCSLWLRLEHLDADIAPLEAHLGFRLLPLPKANASARRSDYRSYFTDADAALIAELCAPDITRFGYRFSPPVE